MPNGSVNPEEYNSMSGRPLIFIYLGTERSLLPKVQVTIVDIFFFHLSTRMLSMLLEIFLV
jgi:hypothetical protein